MLILLNTCLCFEIAAYTSKYLLLFRNTCLYLEIPADTSKYMLYIEIPAYTSTYLLILRHTCYTSKYLLNLRNTCLYFEIPTYTSKYSKTCVKRPLIKRPRMCFQYQLLLHAGQKYCRMPQGEHSVMLLTCIKLPSLFCLFLRGRFTQVLLHLLIFRNRYIC